MDAYDRKARLYPALIASLPLTLLAVLLVGQANWYTASVALFATCGLHVLIIQVVRDRGVAAQEALWSEWGGPPTTSRLRWRTAVNAHLHEHLHQTVEKATGIELPTAADEAKDPEGADQRYELAVKVLRQRTAGDDFPRVRHEVANYGFRRNLHALRGPALRFNGFMLGAEIGWLILILVAGLSLTVAATLAATVVVTVGHTACWMYVITPDFVRRDADRYAEALLDAAAGVGG